MNRILLASFLLLLASGARAAPDDGLRRLASDLASKVANDFPVLEGSVVGFDGPRVLLDLETPPRQGTPNIDFFRVTEPRGAIQLYRRIGVGRILSLERLSATAEILSSLARIESGDRFRTSLDQPRIGIVFDSLPSSRPSLAELLALRVALELNARGRFHAELLGAPPDEASAAWRGFHYLLFLRYVEDGAQATLLGRLVLLRDSTLVDLVSAQAPLDHAWQLLADSMGGSGPPPLAGPVHVRAELPFRPVALLLLELQDTLGVLVLGRAELQLYLVEGQLLRRDKIWPIPPEFLAPTRSRDFLGELIEDGPGQILVGHTLLRQGLLLDLATGRWQAQAEPLSLNLGSSSNPLGATYQPGSNRLDSWQIPGGSRKQEGGRFVRWFSAHELLFQGLDYRLRLMNASTGMSQILSPSLGAGLAFLQASDAAWLSTTEPVVDGQDQITIYRFESGRPAPFWKSDPWPNPIWATSLKEWKGHLCLAAADGTQLQLVLNLPYP